MSEAVVLEVQAGIAIVRLDRESNRNAMTPELLDAFEARIGELRRRSDVRAVIVTGSGACFCSGADFRTAAELMQRSGLEGQPGLRESARRVYASFLCLLELELPVIAAINGHAIGGGLGLALACDLRVASRSARLGANFVRLGLHPGMAVSYILPRLIGVERAAELLFTGRIVTGEEAERLGLVGAAVEPAEVLPRAHALAEEIAAAAPYAVRLTKRSLYDALGFDPRAAVEREAYAQALCGQTEDAREGISALFGKRKPEFKGR
jgi:enoyl-CoA hydratase/carnithine racemase